MQAYERWHQAYPQREFYFAHTGREELDIHERRRLASGGAMLLTLYNQVS